VWPALSKFWLFLMIASFHASQMVLKVTEGLMTLSKYAMRRYEAASTDRVETYLHIIFGLWVLLFALIVLAAFYPYPVTK
jgi:hypothetical protein